jgi:hypothetical protein
MNEIASVYRGASKVAAKTIENTDLLTAGRRESAGALCQFPPVGREGANASSQRLPPRQSYCYCNSVELALGVID